MALDSIGIFDVIAFHDATVATSTESLVGHALDATSEYVTLS